MITVQTRNVHLALPKGIDLLSQHGIEEETRNGPAIVAPTPVTTVYEKPCERVIFWRERDANPFFHLFEAIWMMTGSNHVGFPAFFSNNIRNYSDDGETFNAAYGHRWRQHFKVDQLATVIEALKKDPGCRRQVIGIWDAGHDLGLGSKDLPCNLAVHFMRREGALDMTVFNRSNDMIWGAYGANAVHFSFLQEFVASAVGLPVGIYYQISDNFHAYTSVLDKIKGIADNPTAPNLTLPNCPYTKGTVKPFPILPQRNNWERWLGEAEMLVSEGPNVIGYQESFFRKVAGPLMKAYMAYKTEPQPKRYKAAINHIQCCIATDWRVACEDWVTRRWKKFMKEGSKSCPI